MDRDVRGSFGSPTDRRPIVISGPSGVGKSTICQKLLEAHPGTFATTVSHTTRKPRPGEVGGRSYYFVSRQEFESLAAENAFLEYAEFSGCLYGTSKQTVADQAARGPVVILDVEMEGVKQLKRAQQQMSIASGAGGSPLLQPRFVFIRPPDLTVLEARLRGRGTEDEDSIQRRLARARAEMEYAETGGVHDKIIVNEDVEAAFQELETFVFQDR